MQITSRFTIAVHLLTCIDYFKDRERVNSEFLADSIGVNPVIVRTVISQLREAGIVTSTRGSSGAKLAKNLKDISFYDIYKAVDSVNEEGLFHFHEQPNTDCPVGRNIHKAMDDKLNSIQDSMEKQMKKISLADVVSDTRKQIKLENNQNVKY